MDYKTLIKILNDPNNWDREYVSDVPEELKKYGMVPDDHMAVANEHLYDEFKKFVQNCSDKDVLQSLKKELLRLREEGKIEDYVDIEELLRLIEKHSI